MRYMVPVVVSCLLMLSLTSCRTTPSDPSSISAAVEIAADVFSTFSGGQVQLAAVAVAKDGTRRDVTREAVWSVSPGLAGAVDEPGLFTAFDGQSGTETVRVVFQGFSDEATVDVSRQATTLFVLPKVAIVKSGEVVHYSAFAFFADGTTEDVSERVTWAPVRSGGGNLDESGVFEVGGAHFEVQAVIGRFQALSDTGQVRFPSGRYPDFDLVRIPAGSFMMGSDSGPRSERPAHAVVLDAFEIGAHEVTNAEYLRFLRFAFGRGLVSVQAGFVIGHFGRVNNLPLVDLTGPASIFVWDADEVDFDIHPGQQNWPVARVSWYGALAFCDFYGFRLPTEAEWEAACRGGQQYEFGTASGGLTHDLANYMGVGGRDGFDGLAPVESFAPNPFGLYDMSGNASEYVFDVFDETYYGRSPGVNPAGPGPAEPLGRIDRAGETTMVLRGGSWMSDELTLKSASRETVADIPQFVDLPVVAGFRVAK